MRGRGGGGKSFRVLGQSYWFQFLALLYRWVLIINWERIWINEWIAVVVEIMVGIALVIEEIFVIEGIGSSSSNSNG